MRNLFSSTVILIVLFFAACSSSEKPVSKAIDTVSAPVSASVYTCPMHPEIQSDKPGSCSICKMDLVAKTEGSAPADSAAADTAAHDSNQH
ncbi:heavy metal-binding domain-containing protein [Daejeonella sp. H1SJ63]|jgi:Cu(I)/Ag(I) efflux system membrane fusion protein|uniref:heavy metal-binding domain-containing protein n=1 Tax=Daejeonella sp. H1SJ63 TaxID=3034145 RepID=UPI0023EDADC5|nr:heavy metal-binding domain-containing protein [Daejeonella sp. H1SJ63]